MCANDTKTNTTTTCNNTSNKTLCDNLTNTIVKNNKNSNLQS